MTLLDTALAYHRSGLVVLPNDPARKFPAGLKEWQQVQPTEADIRRWFGQGQHAIGIRDVEGIDIDNKGHPDAATLYADWAALVEYTAPGLVERLLCEQTPSGGFHLVWRCEEIAGNTKLATRPPTPDELVKAPRLTSVTLIETRGKGGQFQVAPSPGYRLVRGDWTQLPTITPAERNTLLACARALSAADSRIIKIATQSTERAGDRYNNEGEAEAYQLLMDAGWTLAYERGDARYLVRPGKDHGISATYGYVAPGVLYVFSDNASPFSAGRAYGSFAIFTELKHDGDYKAAARALHERYEAADKKRPKQRVNLRTGEIIDASDASPAKPVGPTEYVVVDWRQKGITAADLYRAEFAPLMWTVENILPEGAAVLAGKPKSRKSWAALGVAVACARGAVAMGRLSVRTGRVLYLDLESNQRRMRGRLFSMVGHAMRDMQNLHVFTDWPRGEDGLFALDEWMAAYPDTVLVVIDVLADFRRPKDPKEDPYAYDRETVKPINAWAEKHRVTVLLIHHTRKMKADDVFDEISGSTGLPSAVATMWVLGRAPNGENEMVLAMRGRDLINDEPLSLEWDDYKNEFVVIGSAADTALSAERRAIIGVLADDQEWTPKDIAAELQRPVNNVKQLLKALLAEGMIEKTGHGKYARVPSRDHFDHFDHDGNDAHSDHYRQSDPKVIKVISPATPDHFSPGHQDAVKGESDQSDRDSKGCYTVDQIGTLWRVWNPDHTEVVSFHKDEAEARAEAERLNGGAA